MTGKSVFAGISLALLVSNRGISCRYFAGHATGRSPKRHELRLLVVGEKIRAALCRRDAVRRTYFFGIAPVALPTPARSALARLLREKGAGHVSAVELDYVFSRANALYARLGAGLGPAS